MPYVLRTLPGNRGTANKRLLKALWISQATGDLRSTIEENAGRGGNPKSTCNLRRIIHNCGRAAGRVIVCVQCSSVQFVPPKKRERRKLHTSFLEPATEVHIGIRLTFDSQHSVSICISIAKKHTLQKNAFQFPMRGGRNVGELILGFQLNSTSVSRILINCSFILHMKLTGKFVCL